MSLPANQRVVKEKATFTYTAYLRDKDGVVIPSASIVTLTLTYYNLRDSSIINSRNAQNVLNTNNVTVHASSGLLTWSGTTSDSVIVDTSLKDGDLEEHVFLFSWTTSTETGRHKDSHLIESLLKVS